MTARHESSRGIYRMSAPAAPAPVGPARRTFSRQDPLSSDALKAWILLRDQGGFWTAGELGRALRPDREPIGSAQQASRWISALHRRGHVVVSPNFTTSRSYGVTARCAPPEGLSLQPGLDLSPL